MNRSMIRFLLSKLLIIEAGLLLIPLIVAFIYHEPNQNLLSISATIGILLAVGLLGSSFKPKNHHIYAKEGVLIVALCSGYFGPSLGLFLLFFRDKFLILSTLSLRSVQALQQLELLSYQTSLFCHIPYSFGVVLPT